MRAYLVQGLQSVDGLVKRAVDLMPGDEVCLTSGATATVAQARPWSGADLPIGCEQRPIVVSFECGSATLAKPDAFYLLASRAIAEVSA